MEYIEKIKKLLCKELDEYAMKQKISGDDLEMIWKLTDTVKNLDKIAMLEEESEDHSENKGINRGGYGRSYDGGMSYDDDMSYARRRRGNVKRDSMGRYSADMHEDYSEERRMGRSSSYDDAKDHMMSRLGAMMEDADPNEREILKDAMRKLEKA